MLKITIACIGKIKETYLSDAIEEYSKRIRRYCRLAVVQEADERVPDRAGEALCRSIRETEGARLLKRIPDQAYVIVLDLRGKQLSSEGFAEKIRKLEINGISHIVFVIGGSIGVSDAVLSRADCRLCFSEMTFPHQLMRVILLEQIYRAFRIIHHEPYHK